MIDVQFLLVFMLFISLQLIFLCGFISIALNEIKIRSKGKPFAGKVDDVLVRKRTVEYLIKYKNNGKPLVAKLIRSPFSIPYKKGDTIRIICISDENKITTALLPGKYGRVYFSAIFCCVMTVLILRLIFDLLQQYGFANLLL